jgi:hypothetical protein
MYDTIANISVDLNIHHNWNAPLNSFNLDLEVKLKDYRATKKNAILKFKKPREFYCLAVVPLEHSYDNALKYIILSALGGKMGGWNYRAAIMEKLIWRQFAILAHNYFV